MKRLSVRIAARTVSGAAEFPAENYIVLKQQDWEKLRPPETAKVGSTWDIDKDVAEQFLTYFFPQTEMCDLALATRADGPYQHKIEQISLRARRCPGHRS